MRLFVSRTSRDILLFLRVKVGMTNLVQSFLIEYAFFPKAVGLGV